MNKKQVIRINEHQLKQIVTESVKRILKEGKVINNKPLREPYSDPEEKHKNRKKQNDYYDKLAGKQRQKASDSNLYLPNKDGSPYRQFLPIDDLKIDFKDYLVYELDSSWDEFKELPREEQKEILERFHFKYPGYRDYRYRTEPESLPTSVWCDAGEYNSGWIPSGYGEY